jgi:hypothetical protein
MPVTAGFIPDGVGTPSAVVFDGFVVHGVEWGRGERDPAGDGDVQDDFGEELVEVSFRRDEEQRHRVEAIGVVVPSLQGDGIA